MTGTWELQDTGVDVGRFRLGPVRGRLGPSGTLAVLGASGAGKTTLLRLWAGFLRASRGTVLRDGRDLRGTPPEHRGIGYVPQGLGLFPHRTVAGNVDYPLDVAGTPGAPARVAELLAQFGLTALARRYPSQLSGGEQQRVAAARALAARPSLLLWDEPLSAVDLVAREDLLDTLRGLRAGSEMALVVVTHDPTVAFSLADQVLLLDQGRASFWGSPDEFVTRPPSPFAARFAGYENVLPPLSEAGPGLSGWIATRAGTGGVAFRAPTVREDGTWTGSVRTVSPSAGGYRYRVSLEGLDLRLWQEGGAPLRPGAPVRFEIPETSLVRLQANGAGPG